MARKAYARRYAQAAFEIALQEKGLEKWRDDLEKLAATVADPALLAALESPKLKLEEKISLLTSRLGDLNPLVLNMVRLLVTRDGVGMTGDIAAEYGRLLDSYNGIEPAEVVTAVPLEASDIERLASNVGSLVGKKVAIKAAVDPEIMGGIIVRVGGKLLDGSTRSKLAALKRELVGA